MKAFIMNGFARNTNVDGFARNTNVDGHENYNGARDYSMNDHNNYQDNSNDYYDDDDPFTGEEMQWSEEEVVNGLSRMQLMSDEELSDEMGKLRLRFGKGKGKKRRKQRKALRIEARRQKKAGRKERKHVARTRRRARREKRATKFGALVRDVAGAIGGGREPDVETYERILQADEAVETEPTWWEKDAFWGMTNQTAVIAGSAVAVVGGVVIWQVTKPKKGKR